MASHASLSPERELAKDGTLGIEWDQLLSSSKQIDCTELVSVKAELWAKYRLSFTLRAEEAVRSKKKLCEKMNIEYSVIGEKPPSGYPLYICLHGGGGTAEWINDCQWCDMQAYYCGSVSVGVYVAPRGITNTWNLHFVRDSYELYDRLIVYMILCYGVDPNRVYLLGFSAGGDGVYQIVPRMADRWAAASMSSGHPNGVRVQNLYHVPFLIQVGELDKAYNRCRVGAEYGVKLSELQQKYPDGFAHECWIHKDKGHNYKDNDYFQCEYAVLCNPKAWLESGDCMSVKRNTNAIAWVSQYRRNPLPTHLIWDVSTHADRSPMYKGLTAPSKLFYWIDIGGQSSEICATCIEACVDRDTNSIHVKNASRCGAWLRILISSSMVDLQRNVKVSIGDQEFQVKLYASLQMLSRTLLERGDPNFMFESEVILSKTPLGSWEISGTCL